MLLLAATTDKLQLVTSAATNVDVHASYVDASNANPPVVQGDSMGRTNTAITTATTTDIVPAPGASDIRNVRFLCIRNKSTTTSNDVTVVFDQNGTDYELIKVTLNAGESLEFKESLGFYVVAGIPAVLTNESTAQQGSGFSSDTYLTGSFIQFGAGAPIVGTRYILRFDVSKTAAGTATPVLTLRTGTAGTTSDTARLTFTWGAGTAASDIGYVELEAVFRTVGSSTSATLIGRAGLQHNLASTGLTTVLQVVVPAVSSGFDSTTASLGIGASWNGGASAAHTVQLVTSQVII